MRRNEEKEIGKDVTEGRGTERLNEKNQRAKDEDFEGRISNLSEKRRVGSAGVAETGQGGSNIVDGKLRNDLALIRTPLSLEVSQIFLSEFRS